MFTHTPVLLSEVLEHLQPEPNRVFVDGTVGLGGHAEVILERVLPVVPAQSTTVHLLAIDKDQENLVRAKSRLARFGNAAVFVQDSFANVKAIAKAHHLTHVDGILLDLGFSSVHVDDPMRGFSFLRSGPLDMRYDKRAGLSAADIVNTWSEDELARIIRQYGEDAKARTIAQAIVATRKVQAFETTSELAEAITVVVPRRGKIHPATQTFQALRIAVNSELADLERALPDMVDLLKPGGRIAIITFHSLEDRIVKRFFLDDDRLEIVNKRVITASKSELKDNPRSRSAKLRVAKKLN